MSKVFDATGLLCTRSADGEWEEKTIELHSIDDIREVFKPYQSSVSQVHISRHLKAYYSIEFLAEGNRNTEARVKDNTSDVHWMVSPVLLVACGSDDLPKVMDENEQAQLRKKVDWY